MSEYQYYEFRAIDRSLTKTEMDELRALSTRATITSTSFVNVYNFGDFRGDPWKLMQRYFDAFLYVANWGTHQFMLRLPRELIDSATASRYDVEEYLQVQTSGEHVILEFNSQEDESSWEDEGDDWLNDLLPLRGDLERGDFRALYLGWLAHACVGSLDDEDDEDDEEVMEVMEPPVPAGLRQLSPALQKLVEFLRIDSDVLEVAAERSATRGEIESIPGDQQEWIRNLPGPDKDALLLRLLADEEKSLKLELLRRFQRETAPPVALASNLSSGSRTVVEILTEARQRAESRRREASERRAREQADRDRERAAARAAHLDDLATRQEQAWRQIESLIDRKRPAEYDQAVTYLKDLREVAIRAQTPEAFALRLGELRTRHAKKIRFLERLDQAKLP